MAASGLSGGMWDLVSWPGIWPGPSALGEQGLSHWITKKVLFFWRRGGSPGFSRHSVPNTWLLERRAILELRSRSFEWRTAASSPGEPPPTASEWSATGKAHIRISSRAAFSWVTWQWFPSLGTSWRIAFPSTSRGQISSKSCQHGTSATSYSLSSSQTLFRGVCISAGFGEGLSRSSASAVGTVAAPVSVTPVFSAVSLTPTNQAPVTPTLCVVLYITLPAKVYCMAQETIVNIL